MPRVQYECQFRRMGRKEIWLACATTPADVPAIAELAQEERLRYVQCSSVFRRLTAQEVHTTIRVPLPTRPNLRMFDQRWCPCGRKCTTPCNHGPLVSDKPARRGSAGKVFLIYTCCGTRTILLAGSSRPYHPGLKVACFQFTVGSFCAVFGALSGRGAQGSKRCISRGNAVASRILENPAIRAMSRSRPMAKPPCGGIPHAKAFHMQRHSNKARNAPGLFLFGASPRGIGGKDAGAAHPSQVLAPETAGQNYGYTSGL